MCHRRPGSPLLGPCRALSACLIQRTATAANAARGGLTCKWGARLMAGHLGEQRCPS
jgi:hypothetical protein